MNRSFSFLNHAVFAVCILLYALGGRAHCQQPDKVDYQADLVPLLNKYCMSCHNSEKKRGEFDLSLFPDKDSVIKDRKLWEVVIEQLDTDEMPPTEGVLTPNERVQLIEGIEAVLKDIDWSKIRHAGHVTIPRLNREEYNNTVRDLLGWDCNPGRKFSDDGIGESGFNTDRDGLYLSTSLAEEYLNAAEAVIGRLVDGSIESEEQLIEAETMYINDDTARPSSWGWRTKRPQDTIYTSIKIKQSGWYLWEVEAWGATKANMVLQVDNEVVTIAYLSGGTRKAPKLYKVLVFLEDGNRQLSFNRTGEGGMNLDRFRLNGPLRSLPEGAKTKYELPPDEDPDDYASRKRTDEREYWLAPTKEVVLSPVPDGSTVFVVEPGDKLSEIDTAKMILERFVSRAFRRPAKAGEVEAYLKIYESEKARGLEHRQAMKMPLSAILVSPHFIFRVEQARSNQEEFELNDYELASRLSYFVWMSMPDDELFDLAAEGKLHDPQVLDAQVDRMLADPRAESFANTFARQWLGYHELGKGIVPDETVFPEFTATLMESMFGETEYFVYDLIRNNGSFLNILDSDYTFVNALMARHYKIEGISGMDYQKVKVTDPNRGGVLGMASVLTATSQPTRTAPVDRGKWVLETLLGKRLPDPPADVPPLPEDAGTAKSEMTFRETLELHRANPACAACHDKIDPIGFGLESFDPLGRSRTEIGGKPIDTSGVLPSGEEFSKPADLRSIMMNKKDDFARSAVENMLSYALGRKLEFYDEATILSLLEKFKNDEYRSHLLIKEIVKSYPFQTQNVSKELKDE